MLLFDTSVLIDARDAASPWHQWAKGQIAHAVATEGACANTVVVSAQSEGLKLVTRDPSRVSTYFPGVRLVTPSEDQTS